MNMLSISVNNSNFTPVFFKQACHANSGADKKSVGSNSYISIHLFLSFQTHVQTVKYHFEHTRHDTEQGFLFQIFPILFDNAHSLYQ